MQWHRQELLQSATRHPRTTARSNDACCLAEFLRHENPIENPFQQIVLGGLAWVLGNIDADVTPHSYSFFSNTANVVPSKKSSKVCFISTIESWIGQGSLVPHQPGP